MKFSHYPMFSFLNKKHFNNSFKIKLLIIFSILFISIFFIRGLFFDTLVWGDNPYISADSNSIIADNFLYSWSSDRLGSTPRMSFGTILPVVITNINFASDFVIYFILKLFPIFLILFSVYYLSYKLVNNHLAALVTSIFSIANPVIFGDFLNGQTLWIYVILPFAIFKFIDIFFKHEFNLKNSILLSIYFFLSLSMLPPIIIFLLISFLVFYIFSIFNIYTYNILFKSILHGLIILILTAALSFGYVLIGSIGETAHKSSSTLTDYYHNYSNTNPSNVIIFTGNEGNGQKTLKYNEFSFIKVAGYILLAILLSSLLFSRKFFNKDQTNYVILRCSVLISLLLLGLIAFLTVNKDIGAILFSDSFIFSTIRNPTKLFILALEFFLPFIAISFSILLSHFKSIKNKLLFFTLFIILLLVYSWPAIRGDLGLFYSKNTTSYTPDHEIIGLTKYLNLSNSKAILIPSNHDDELMFQNISSNLNTLRLGGYQFSTQEYINALIKTFNEQDSNFKNILSKSDINIIVLKKNYLLDNQGNFKLFPVEIPYNDAKLFLDNSFPILYESDSYILYKKENYRSSIFAFDKILGVNGNDLSEVYLNYYNALNVIGSTSTSPFYNLEKNRIPYSTNIILPFKNINRKNILNGRIYSIITNFDSNNKLYVATNNHGISYKKIKDELTFKSEFVPGLSLNDVVIQTFATSTTLSTFPILESEEYVATQGSRIIPLEKNSNWTEIGITDDSPTVYKVSPIKNVFNGSFEEGLWKEKVGNCNNYDELPVLSMSREKKVTDGDWSLQLGATRHTACTNTDITGIDADNLYFFSFYYQSESAKQAGFYLSFGKSTTTAISERLPITRDDWKLYEKIIRIPADSNGANLSLYAYATDEETNNIVRYDNVQMSKLSEIGKVNPKIQDKFVATSLAPSEGERTFSFTDSSMNLDNKVHNGDLLQGLWNKEVGDCNNYDELSDLAMDLVTDSRDSGKSLALTATRHTACTGPQSVFVTGDKTYLLSFEYQSDQKTEAGFNLAWNGTTSTPISKRLQINDSTWQVFETQVTAPEGATSASLLLYAYEKDGLTPMTVRYDTVSLIELPNIQNRYYLVSDPQTNFVEPKEITFDLINPTKKLVHIKGATTPFYLAMSESFHQSWQAQFNTDKINGFFDSWVPFVNPDRIPDEHHFELNGFLNGWYIDTPAYCVQNTLCTQNPDGSYDIELVLEFFPQRWFYLGMLISGTTLVGLVIFLLYDWRRRRLVSKSKQLTL